MALTEGPAHLVHGSLIAPLETEGNDHDPVEVRMVRDAPGYTYHERRPRLVHGKAGETLTVSRNLALLWAASGQCVLFPVETEPAPVAAEPVSEEPPEPVAVEEEPAAEPKEPAPTPKRGKRRRRR